MTSRQRRSENSIFSLVRTSFALPKLPNLHRAFVLGVFINISMTVVQGLKFKKILTELDKSSIIYIDHFNENLQKALFKTLIKV